MQDKKFSKGQSLKVAKVTEDQQKVLRLIKKAPGLSAGSLEWLYLGGQVKNGKPVPTNLGVVDPDVFTKAKKAGSRASELAAGSTVFKKKISGSHEIGYWPVVFGTGVTRVSTPTGRDVSVVAGIANTERVLGPDGVASERAALDSYLED